MKKSILSIISLKSLSYLSYHWKVYLIYLIIEKSILFILSLKSLSYLSYHWEVYLIYHIIEKSTSNARHHSISSIYSKSSFNFKFEVWNIHTCIMHHASSITIHCSNFNNNSYEWAACFSETSIRMMKTKIENENEKKWSMLFIKFLIKTSIKKSIDISINYIFIFNK